MRSYEHWKQHVRASRTLFQEILSRLIVAHGMEAYDYLNISMLSHYPLRALLMPQVRAVMMSRGLFGIATALDFSGEVLCLDEDGVPEPRAFERLLHLLSEEGCTLSFFDPTATNHIFVQEDLELMWEDVVWGSVPDAFQEESLRRHGKTVFHELMRHLNLARYAPRSHVMAPGGSVELIDAMRSELGCREDGHVVVKDPSGAGGVGIVDTRDIAGMVRFLEQKRDVQTAFVFEESIAGPADTFAPSLSVQFMLDGGTLDGGRSVHILGVTKQHLKSRYVAVGNMMCPDAAVLGVSDEQVCQMYVLAHTIASFFAEPFKLGGTTWYARKGYGSVDFVLRADGTPVANELGLRWTNGGYVVALSLLAEQLHGSGYVAANRVLEGSNVPSSPAELSVLLSDMGLHFQRREDKTGLIPVLSGHGKCTVGCIATDVYQLEGLMRKLQGLIS